MTVTVSVSSTSSNPTHHVSISDGVTDIGMNVKGFPRNFRQFPYSPSSLQFSTGRQGYGSFEPPYTSIDQKDWVGGRGQLNYSDASQYYDSYNAWTLTDEVLMPAPLWRFAKGLRLENVFMPGDTLTAGGTQNSTVTWQAMSGSDNSQWLAHKFTVGGTGYDVDGIWLFMRYYGSPGNLIVYIYDDSSNPTTQVSDADVTLTTANISKVAPEGDLIGQLICFKPTTRPSLTASTDYWVVVKCADADNTTNYWEVAYGNQGGTAARSSDGSSWTATAARTIFYRVEEEVPDGKIHFIEYKRGLYACTEPANGGPGQIYLNGDRGIAIGGAASTLEQIEINESNGTGSTGSWLTPANRFKWAHDGSSTAKLSFDWKLTWDRTIGANNWNIYVTIKMESGLNPSAGIGMAHASDDFVGTYSPIYTDGTTPTGFVQLATEVRSDGYAIANTVKAGYFGLTIESGGVDRSATFRITKIQARDVTTTVYYTLWDETTSDKLTDTTKSWTVNEWAGAYCHIWNGTGQGQRRLIESNTADTLTVTPPWDIAPTAGSSDVGSEYVIKGTDKWQNVSPLGVAVVTSPITDVMELWGILYVAQGELDYLVRLREYNNSGVWTDFWGSNAAAATATYDGTNYALFVDKTYDPVNENFVWRARNENPAEWTGLDQTSISKADDVNWGTNLTFGNPIPIGSRDYLITKIVAHNNLLWVGKENSVWWLDSDGTYDRAYQMQVGLEAISSPTNCVAMASKDLWLWFNWAHSIERLYGTTLEDVGPWRGAGIIKRAKGTISFLEPAIGWMFYGVDANHDGQSSIMVLTRGHHTLFRGPSIVEPDRDTPTDFGGVNDNPRIRSGHWQSVAGQDATAWFWYEFGGDIMFMQMPISSLNPAQDDDVMFAPESYVVQSQMDTGYAELEKYYGKSRVVAQNTSGTIYVDYDVNPDVHALSFTNATKTGSDPAYEYAIGSSRQRNIMTRVRTSVSDISDTTKNNIDAVILDAFARKPVKYNWEMRIKLDENAKTIPGKEDHVADTLLDQLKTWSEQAQALTLRSVDTFADDSGSGRTVVVEPPNPFRTVWNKATRKLFGYATVTLREL